jgi:hypothetical protein
VAVHDLEGLSVDDLKELCLHPARSWDQAGIVTQIDELAFDDRRPGRLQSLREIGLIADLLVTPPGAAALAQVSAVGTVKHWTLAVDKAKLGRAPTPAGTAAKAWMIKIKESADPTFRTLKAADLEDLILVVSYTAKA